MSEKTEEPTAKRLQKAREEGDGGASKELGSALGFVLGSALVASAAQALFETATKMLKTAFAAASSRAPSVSLHAAAPALAVVALVVPLLLAVAIASAVSAVVQSGGGIATKRLSPNLARLDPFSGFRGLFSSERAFSVLRSFVCAVAISYVTLRVLHGEVRALVSSTGNVPGAMRVAAVLSFRVVRIAAVLGLALAFLDVIVVRRAWWRKLRMSRDEVKREYRESEGDPELKQARERAHHEMMAAAAIGRVRDATVIVVNPTHVACALRYAEEEGHDAPVVVARGEGALARQIVEAARAYGVPVLRDVPLARALVELEEGEPIPEALYEAVAEILRDAFDELERERG